MWNVSARATSGVTYDYKVPAGKDTDRAFVLALAYQEHATKVTDDPLTVEATVTWTSDNVFHHRPIALESRQNYVVERKTGKGLWERHSVRGYRTLPPAEEALESAATEFPHDKFRIVLHEQTSTAIAVSKNLAIDPSDEETPEEVAETNGETTEEVA